MGFQTFKSVGLFLVCVQLTLSASAIETVDAQQTEAVRVLTIQGKAEASTNGVVWRPLTNHEDLTAGTHVRTGDNSLIDLQVLDTGASFRVTPNSELLLETIDATQAGDMLISDFRVDLAEGTILGSQPTLSSPSSFQISTANGRVDLSDTQYAVRADGAVTALSGSVRVVYAEPGRGGAIRVTVSAGESFDPETGTVVETTPEYLENLIAEVETTAARAIPYKVEGSTVVVQPDKPLSPSRPSGGGTF
jgi:hypothetical protein